MNIDILPVKGKEVWPLFAPHHYLTGKYAGHRAFLAVLEDGTAVAFASSISGIPKPAYGIHHVRREHRTVVLPDFQGLGLGARLSEWLGAWHIRQGHRFYSRTAHPRLGAHRDLSPLWRPTAMNRKQQGGRLDYNSDAYKGEGITGGGWERITRPAYSHEYVGAPRDPSLS